MWQVQKAQQAIAEANKDLAEAKKQLDAAQTQHDAAVFAVLKLHESGQDGEALDLDTVETVQERIRCVYMRVYLHTCTVCRYTSSAEPSCRKMQCNVSMSMSKAPWCILQRL